MTNVPAPPPPEVNDEERGLFSWGQLVCAVIFLVLLVLVIMEPKA